MIFVFPMVFLWIVSPKRARFYTAGRWIKRAYHKKRWHRAEALCHKHLAEAERFHLDWNYGNAIHNGNQVLGLIRLRQGDVEGAKAYLLAAGISPGSPQLDSFGPNMMLARELLERNERLVVTEYVDLIARFWTADKPAHAEIPGHLERMKEKRRLIEEWKIDIAQGRIPKDGLWHQEL
jgi:hypothetical protein